MTRRYEGGKVIKESEDLADENFSWEAYHSADEIELKRLGHHYV